jgi:hypothetical protein
LEYEHTIEIDDSDIAAMRFYINITPLRGRRPSGFGYCCDERFFNNIMPSAFYDWSTKIHFRKKSEGLRLLQKLGPSNQKES